MLKELKDLAGMHPVWSRTETYNIVRYYSPDMGSRCVIVKEGVSLAEAQSHCQDPATKCEGEWFDGYVAANSRTGLLLWKAFK